MSALLADICLTVIDFETTGPVPGYPNQPWQIGLVEVRAGEVVAETITGHWLQVGDRPFNRHAPGRHAQLRPLLREAPTLHDLWTELAPRLSLPLVAHNTATERSMLAAAFPLHRFGPWVDTLDLARRAWPGLRSYALEDLVLQLGLGGAVSGLCPGLAAHDARYDAVAAALVLCHLLQEAGWSELRLDDLSRLM